MKAQIVEIGPKQLVGKRISTSLMKNETFELWNGFMKIKSKYLPQKNMDLYSVEIYPDFYFNEFNPNTLFEKWAGCAITEFDTVPEEFESMVLPGGLYAVFTHCGKSSQARATFQYIFETWLPASPYLLDKRPHFELMGANYKQDSQESEEDFFIPIKLKP